VGRQLVCRPTLLSRETDSKFVRKEAAAHGVVQVRPKSNPASVAGVSGGEKEAQ